MISIQDGERFVILCADEYYGAEGRAVPEHSITYRFDLRQEPSVQGVLRFGYTFDDPGEGEITPCNSPPLCPGKDPDPAEVCLPHLELEPFRVRRELIPQGQVADEEQRTPLVIFDGIVEVGAGDDSTQRFVILVKAWLVEVTLQKFCDHLVF